jgi:hypothetical protein
MEFDLLRAAFVAEREQQANIVETADTATV